MKFLSQTTTIFLMALLVLSCGKDDDCTTQSFYLDRDMDGFGAGEATEACEAPSASVGQYVLVAGDTDDNDANINPDCDRIFYVDADGDGFGVGEPLTFCEEPSEGSYTENATEFDCDDDDPDVFPGNTEIMDNGIDDDCDPSTPDSVPSILFDFDTNTTINPTNITEVINGITMTVSGDSGFENVWRLIPNGDIVGSSGNFVTNPIFFLTTVTFTFDQQVTVNSIYAIEGDSQSEVVFTFTPDNLSGDNEVVVATLTDGAITVDLNWTDVTSFTVTKSGGMFAFDDLNVTATED